MNRRDDNDNEIDDVYEQMRREFGARESREGEVIDGPPSPPPPLGQGSGIPPMMPNPTLPRPAAARPRAAMVLLWAIGLIYIISGMLSGSLYQPSLPVLIALGAKENTLVASGEYWRLIGAMFLHGNLLHIFFNGYALFALGPESERIFGTGRFLVLYFLAGIAGSIASYALSPEPSVGASGAIFGLIGALGLFYYLNRKVLGEFGRMQIQSMAAIVMINLIIGFSAQGTIDNWGHLGGLVGGALAALALAPRLDVDDRFYPPVLTQRHVAYEWAAALGLLVALLGLVMLLPPAR